MKKINLFFILFLVGLISLQSNQSFAAKKNNSNSTKTKQTQKNDNTSPSSVIYVFPVEQEKQPFKPVKRVITGVFTNKQQEKALEEDKENAQKAGVIQKREIPPRTLNEKTIAWITPMGLYYHDPQNNCLNIKERSWIEERKEILGLEPCPDCFKKLNKTPEYIKKYSANYDVASADKLLDNSQFIEWIKDRQPVKDINFISGTKLIAYPNEELTTHQMHQMAIEIQNAYMRQTWRIIEVWVKSKPDVVQYVSSFSPTAELHGVRKSSPASDSSTANNTKNNKAKKSR
ncbi:MAG: hypothetical protein II961_07435 [Candidatus Riflebacteria bacterium]|nr:hypothetical protein [Candidatus Riflebacteria bacterium]